MKYILTLSLAFCLLVVSGCATKEPKNLDSFHNAQPDSILVIPPKNKSTDVQATTSVLATLPYYLGEKGYYVFPVNTVKTLLEYEGYYEPAEVHNAPPEQLAKLFHADSVLYVTVQEWTSKYVVFAATTEVELEYKLVNSDGAVLWEAQQRTAYSPNNNNSGGIFGVVANAVAAAAERASPNYLPLTRKAHAMAIVSPLEGIKDSAPLAYAMSKSSEDPHEVGIPPGPHSPKHDKYYKTLKTKE